MEEVEEKKEEEEMGVGRGKRVRRVRRRIRCSYLRYERLVQDILRWLAPLSSVRSQRDIHTYDKFFFFFYPPANW